MSEEEKQIWEHVEYCNNTLGGDWFYNTRKCKFEDYMTDRELTKKQLIKMQNKKG